MCKNVPPLRYTPEWLHSRRFVTVTSPTVCELSLAGIHKHATVFIKKTKRGKRAGRRKQRHIGVHSSIRPTAANPPTMRVNKNNLINIDTRNIYVVPSTSFLIGHQNCRSCRNKVSEIRDLIYEQNIDLMFLTETWLKKDDDKLMEPIKPPGYYFRSFPRIDRGGGGIALLMKTAYLPQVESVNELSFASFQAISIILKLANRKVSLACVYKPPKSKKYTFTDSEFLVDFKNFINGLYMSTADCIILGDFNIHYDNQTNTLTKKVNKVFREHDLKQYVNGPTQTFGHTIDWVIAPESNSFIQSVHATDKMLSDHHLITCETVFEKQKSLKTTVTSRDLKSIDLFAFQTDLKNMFSNVVDDCLKFNDACRQVIDLHAPVKTRTVTERIPSPWFSLEQKEVKQERRRAERKWRDTGLYIHKTIFMYFKNKVTTLCDKAKVLFFNNKFKCVKNCKELYQTTKSLFNENSMPTFPTAFPMCDLPDLFSDFFNNKVSDIRKKLNQTSPPNENDRVFTGIPFSFFRQVSEDEVKDLILKSPSKSCGLDAIPTQLLKNSLSDLLPSITKIINVSLSSGIVPPSFKDAIVNPLLKKLGLDQNQFNNYRPVSNLPFLSKILEKVVLKQLMEHIIKNKLRQKFQSAYRMFHSTETALLRVFNDLINALDDGNVCVLTLLDLSAAFDTIDHDILLSRLETSFGISGSVHDWFKSYLTGRTNRVKVGDNFSKKTVLDFGVPQGSVLGPILFTLYTEPLADIIKLFEIIYHFYADDSQLYKSVPIKELLNEVRRFEECIKNVQIWMNNNMLMLNGPKTEYMILGKPSSLKKINENVNMILNGSTIIPTEKVKNLGVMFDHELDMNAQVNSLCKTMFFSIRKIGMYRKYMTQDVAEKLVVSLVLSRMDYCNCLLVGLPDYVLQQLQYVQNCAARMIFRKRKNDHVTCLLRSLHWLPVKYRIIYKTAMLVFKILKNKEPAYLKELLNKPPNVRINRSASDDTLLLVPRTKLVSYGDRSFAYFGPFTWNNLPLSLRNIECTSTFKRELKTYLFIKAYL